MSGTTTNSLYVIPAETPEKQRLGKQYAFKRAVCGWDAPIPSSLDVSNVSDVLDVAAGTCAWTLDFANQPQIKPRLALPDSALGPTPVRLFACDIDTKFFPDKALTDRFGVSTFQQDATVPFPPELHGKFDLVHVSFLFLCLTEAGWRNALQNIGQVLKPGGTLMIDEADPIMYLNVESVPSEDGLGHDLTARLSDPGAFGKANRIYAGFALENNFIPDMTFRLPALLRDAGFAVKDTQRLYAPSGALCASFEASGRAPVAEFADFTVDNYVFIFEHLAGALFAKGALREPDGTPVTTKEGLQAMLKEIDAAFRAGARCRSGGIALP
ncbi:hypothetical protein C8Q78DRAFT_1040168 [Trametes maxima]|nr:hypothetical protein C8Q78DRAFT_1040168 [Trametes maxima]